MENEKLKTVNEKSVCLSYCFDFFYIIFLFSPAVLAFFIFVLSEKNFFK